MLYLIAYVVLCYVGYYTWVMLNAKSIYRKIMKQFKKTHTLKEIRDKFIEDIFTLLGIGILSPIILPIGIICYAIKYTGKFLFWALGLNKIEEEYMMEKL